MIPNYHNRQVDSSGVEDVAAFGISEEDSAHIMTILRDTLYSDKVLAVLREYSANAWDAHREVGKFDVPIKVVLPTLMDPTLTIQDFGPGISHENIKRVYTQYGKSTKRGTDLAVGMLGIGSKSAFAYSDSFTIVSSHGGLRRTYVAVLDETEKGYINCLYSEECGDETGVSIKVPVRPTDVREFTLKAQELYKHFIPRPDINTVLPAAPELVRVLSHGVIHETEYSRDNGEWIAIMGCIPYEIDIEQLIDSGLGQHVRHLTGSLFFNIGELGISASRESLKYSDATKKALVNKFNDIIDEYVRTTLTEIDKENLSLWEKRIRAQTLTRLHLPCPKDVKDLTKKEIELEKPKTFTFGQGSSRSVTVDRDTRLILLNDRRDKSGFQLAWHDELLHPIGEATVAEMETELRELVKKAEIDGVPIFKLSALPWVAPPPKPKKPTKIVPLKHKVTTFVLKDAVHFSHPWSDCWNVQSRVPDASDVYVILDNFKAGQNNNFYYEYRTDKHLFEAFGGKMPPIYGYKTTKKKPRDSTNCEGKDYFVWRKEYAKTLVTPEIQKKLDLMEWSRAVDIDDWRFKRYKESPLDFLKKELGKDHPLIRFLRKYTSAKKRFAKLGSSIRSQLPDLQNRVKVADVVPQAVAERRALFQRYPLFSLSHIRFWRLYDQEERSHWIQYVKCIDQLLSTGQVITPPEELNDSEEDNDVE